MQAKGITWCKREKRWIARLYTNGKQIRLGQFKTEAEASAAYLEALHKYDLASKLRSKTLD